MVRFRFEHKFNGCSLEDFERSNGLTSSTVLVDGIFTLQCAAGGGTVSKSEVFVLFESFSLSDVVDFLTDDANLYFFMQTSQRQSPR